MVWVVWLRRAMGRHGRFENYRIGTADSNWIETRSFAGPYFVSKRLDAVFSRSLTSTIKSFSLKLVLQMVARLIAFCCKYLINIGWCHWWCMQHCDGMSSSNNSSSSMSDSSSVYGAVIMAQPLWEFTRCIWWMQCSDTWLSTFVLSQSARARATDLPISSYSVCIHHRLEYYCYVESRCKFYHPV